MINLCLPMKVINVTQASGGSYSHSNNCLDLAGEDAGIDFAFALGDYWKCISGPWGSNTYFFTATDSKGKPVEVHCADGINRVVTVAMTHADFYYVVKPTIGRIYKSGEAIYEEGVHGKATGNHIHYEVAEGLQYGKHWDASYGVYRMNGELKPESVCYICDSFSKVKSTHGIDFRHCSGIYTEDTYMELFDGMNWLKYGDITLTAYQQPDDWQIGLFNAEKLTEPNKIDRPDLLFIEKSGNDFFQMKSGQADPIGTVYGPRVCCGGPVDEPTNSESYLYYRLDKDGTVSMGDWDGVYKDPTNIQMMCSPQMIFNVDWANPKYAPMAGGMGILNAPYYQAYFGRTKKGKFFKGVTKGRLSARAVWAYFRENYDVHDMAFMDGGSVEGKPGSAQQWYWNPFDQKMDCAQASNPVRATRDILAFYKPIGSTPIPDPEPVIDPIDDLKKENEHLKDIIKRAKEILDEA